MNSLKAVAQSNLADSTVFFFLFFCLTAAAEYVKITSAAAEKIRTQKIIVECFHRSRDSSFHMSSLFRLDRALPFSRD